jgi:glycosyltransferase involved in cell wall biosynthesis
LQLPIRDKDIFNIGIDGRPLQDNSRYRGIGRYVEYLLKYSTNNLSGKIKLNLLFDDNYCSILDESSIGFNNIDRIPTSQCWRSKIISFAILNKKLRSEVKSKTYFNKSYKNFLRKYDLFHFTSTYNIIHCKKIATPFIVTIYDLIPLIYKEEYFGDSIVAKRILYKYYLNSLKVLLNKAIAVITISENTKKDIISILGISSEKIHVIYLGIGSIFNPCLKNKKDELNKRFNINSPYLMYSGGMDYRKNLKITIEAFAKFIQTHKMDLKLIIAGKFEYKTKHLIQKANKLGIKNRVIFIDYISDYDLILLLNNAHLYLFLSLYEGFGFPPLEAMACKTPVLSSNTSCLPEILGDAAHYVDPADVDQIVEGIYTLLKETEYRNELVEKGYKHVKEFTPQKTAQKTIELYGQLYQSLLI